MKKVYKLLFPVLVLFLMGFTFAACDTGVNITINFDSNGGTVCDSIKTNGTTAVKVPKNPTKDNFDFDGWFWDNGIWAEPFTINSILDKPVSDTMTLTVYAKWKGIDVIIIYDYQGATDNFSPENETIEYGSSFNLIQPIKTDYDFAGWYTAPDGQGSQITDETGAGISDCTFHSTTLYAKWVYIADLDRTPPVLVKIDDWMIPMKWGRSIYKYDDAAPNQKIQTSATVRFPYPKYTDDSGIARVSFEVIDKVNNNTVIKIYNICDMQGNNDNTYRYNPSNLANGYYITDSTEKLKFETTGLEFNFDNYINNPLLNGIDGLGKYTVHYQAFDIYQNIATKTYDVMLEQVYQDLCQPDISVTFDDSVYLSYNTNNYTIPFAKCIDALTVRLQIEYTITTENDVLAVKNGESLRVIHINGEIYLENDNHDSINITNSEELVFTIIATDSVGNVSMVSKTVNLYK